MKKIVKITALAMAVIFMTAFADVPEDYWAYSSIEQAKNKGLVNGVSVVDDLFEPARAISAQEVALLLYRTNQRYTISDADIAELTSKHAIELVSSKIDLWAEGGIAYGFENGFWSFLDFLYAGGGAGEASRELIAKWIKAVSPRLNIYGLRLFRYDDNSLIDPAYYPYVDTMYKYGIMRGSDDNCFYAKRSITRAEAAAVAVRTESASVDLFTTVDKEPFVYELGTACEFNEKYNTFNLGSILVNIDANAGILLDGSLSSFSGLKKFDGKKISVSQCLTGKNTNNFVVQSKPSVCSGIVEKIQSVDNKKLGVDPYDIVTINVGGLSVDFVKTTETDVLKTISVEAEVQFISDGIYLLEIM